MKKPRSYCTKKNGGRWDKKSGRGVFSHLFPDFIDMHDHIEGRAGEAVSLPVEGIDRELHELVRYRLGSEFLEIDQVAGIQADLVAELLRALLSSVLSPVHPSHPT